MASESIAHEAKGHSGSRIQPYTIYIHLIYTNIHPYTAHTPHYTPDINIICTHKHLIFTQIHAYTSNIHLYTPYIQLYTPYVHSYTSYMLLIYTYINLTYSHIQFILNNYSTRARWI